MQKAIKTDGNNKTRQTKLNNYKKIGAVARNLHIIK